MKLEDHACVLISIQAVAVLHELHSQLMTNSVSVLLFAIISYQFYCSCDKTLCSRS